MRYSACVINPQMMLMSRHYVTATGQSGAMNADTAIRAFHGGAAQPLAAHDARIHYVTRLYDADSYVIMAGAGEGLKRAERGSGAGYITRQRI
jgi:hypothetical protein